MLHNTIEITRLLIIALPCTFLAFAGLDLTLRIATAFGSLRQNEQTPQSEPVAATSTETQTEKAVEAVSMPLLQIEPVEPTCPEQKPTSSELNWPLPAIETPLSQLKRYKLHGHDVVPVAQLPITIPSTIKRYKLRGEAVVRLSDIA